eukprot:354237-Chlamydomonas_euryale.AAC.10
MMHEPPLNEGKACGYAQTCTTVSATHVSVAPQSLTLEAGVVCPSLGTLEPVFRVRQLGVTGSRACHYLQRLPFWQA